MIIILKIFYIYFNFFNSSQAPSTTPATQTTAPSRPTESSQNVPSVTVTPTSHQAESALLMGEEYDVMVRNIMDMGYVT